MTNIENKQQEFRLMQSRVGHTAERLQRSICHVDVNTFRIKQLAYKYLALETKFRDRNVIIYGLEEREREGTSITTVLRDFFNDYLGFVKEDLYIDFARRVGTADNTRRGMLKRPLLCTLDHSSEVSVVMKEAKRLKGTRFSIDRDYPSEIAEARKKLWPEVKRLRGIPGQNVQLQFPSRIVLNGQITKDAFPHWDETLKPEIMKDFRFILQEEQAARVLFNRKSAPFCQAASQEGAPVSTHMPGNIDRQSESMNGASRNHVNFIPQPLE